MAKASPGGRIPWPGEAQVPQDHQVPAVVKVQAHTRPPGGAVCPATPTMGQRPSCRVHAQEPSATDPEEATRGCRETCRLPCPIPGTLAGAAGGSRGQPVLLGEALPGSRCSLLRKRSPEGGSPPAPVPPHPILLALQHLCEPHHLQGALQGPPPGPRACRQCLGPGSAWCAGIREPWRPQAGVAGPQSCRFYLDLLAHRCPGPLPGKG